MRTCRTPYRREGAALGLLTIAAGGFYQAGKLLRRIPRCRDKMASPHLPADTVALENTNTTVL